MRRQAAGARTLARAVKQGRRAALAQAITLVESTKDADREQAGELMKLLIPAAGGAVRLGVTGAPGVGKSTLIDQLGLDLISAGKRVAVLAVDPSSSRSGGSVLADKTRMARLAVEASAFIRPSPSAGAHGGSARGTREAVVVCEAAGFDVVIVETVGVGQSEAAVADLVDFVAVLVGPGGGDELQGLKRGVIEIADMIAVTKADGASEGAAARTAGSYRAALNIVTPAEAEWRAPVIQVSALTNAGLGALWDQVMRHRAMAEASGALVRRRREQDVRRFRALVEEGIVARYRADAALADQLGKFEAEVGKGRLTPAIAADRALGAGRNE